MAFLDILRQLLKHEDTAARLEARAGELRGALQNNPNDVGAFDELAQLVRDAGESAQPADPLTADTADITVSADLALWSLAEEIGASPDAWYPLVELARLSVENDREGALRRLGVAADRDNSGAALAAGIRVLREADLANDALSFGTGRWVPGDHSFAAGEEIVRAAIEAGKTDVAERYLDVLTRFESPANRGEFASLRGAIAKGK
ncbi:hypothetical protein I6E29_03690 [Arcanobacterium haemolyticum]|nr:hypothetical protein [Arcanobacterium haemolyticum]